MTFGFASPVILRTSRELAALVKGVPFHRKSPWPGRKPPGRKACTAICCKSLSNRQTLPPPPPDRTGWWQGRKCTCCATEHPV